MKQSNQQVYELNRLTALKLVSLNLAVPTESAHFT